MAMVSKDVDLAIRLQEPWPVFSSWEGKTGHPRRMLDTLISILGSHGYNRLLTPEPSVRPSAVPNASDFDGAVVFGRRGTRLQALRERRVAVIIGLVLAIGLGVAVFFGLQTAEWPSSEDLGTRLEAGGGVAVIAGLWVLIVLSAPKWYCIALSWRGETYQAAGSTEASTTVRQAANVVSDVRLLVHTLSGFKNPLRRSKPLRVDPKKQAPDFQSSVKPIIDEVEKALPRLIPEWA